MSPITTSIQDDVDAKSGLDTGVSTTTGHHAQHHIDLATGVNALVGQWIPLHVAQVNLTAAVAGTYVAVWTLAEETLASVSMQANAFYLNSADYAVTGWTMQLRVVAAFMQSTTANAGTSVMTAGLYPLTMGGTTDVGPDDRHRRDRLDGSPDRGRRVVSESRDFLLVCRPDRRGVRARGRRVDGDNGGGDEDPPPSRVQLHELVG
jgi:hypothetical protein